MVDMELRSSFQNGQSIPRKCGYKEMNSSPPLYISGIPQTTRSLALIMDDPDAMAPAGKIWVHWLLWNLDPHTTNIPENTVPSGAVQGMNDFEQSVYGGPAPPDKRHTYVFKLYALNVILDLKTGSTKKELERTISDHILDEAILTGTYDP